MDGCYFHDLSGPVPRDSYPDSFDLYGSVAEDADVFDSVGAASAASSATAAGRRAGDSQADSALDGRRQAGDSEGHPEGHQDY